MRKLLILVLACALLTGCAAKLSVENAPLYEANEVDSGALLESAESPEMQPEAVHEDDPCINYEWYRDCPVFIREDGEHTFQMGWLDSGYLQFLIDDELVIGQTNSVDDSIIPDGLFYESIGDDGTVGVVYYYAEDYIRITDKRSDSENYSGVYYPMTDAPAQSEINAQSVDWYSGRVFRNSETNAFLYVTESEGVLFFRVNHRQRAAIKADSVEALEDTEHGSQQYVYKMRLGEVENVKPESADKVISFAYNTWDDSVIVYDEIANPFDCSGMYGYWRGY